MTTTTTTNRTNVTVWDATHSGGTFSGRLDRTLDHWAHELRRGAAITRVGSQPFNHHVAGYGVQHDDAQFAETGRSMAAYYENGDHWDGLKWWDDEAPNYLRRDYGREVR